MVYYMSNRQSFLSARPQFIPCIIAAAFLLGALGAWPYGYYKLLRVVVCLAAAYVAYLGYDSRRFWATWLFGLIVILFNPIIPVHLTREIWQPIDVGSAILFIGTGFFFRTGKNNST